MPFMKASCINDDKLKTETKRNRTHTPRAYYLIQFVCLFLSIMYVVQIGINSYCTVWHQSFALETITAQIMPWLNVHCDSVTLVSDYLTVRSLIWLLACLLCYVNGSFPWNSFSFDILGAVLKLERTETSRNTCKSKLAINLVSLWCAMDSYVHFLLWAPIPVMTSR